MLINQLPDDCLLLIFGNLKILEDLIATRQVCSRWRSLISHFFTKTKCLLKITSADICLNPIFMRNSSIIRNIDLIGLFPNLQVIEVERESVHVIHERFLFTPENFTNSSTRGLILPFTSYKSKISWIDLLKYSNISMYLCARLDLLNCGQNVRSQSTLQAYITNCCLQVLESYGSTFTNLQRLHINTRSFVPYPGPNLPSLRILELSFPNRNFSQGSSPPVASIIDLCPDLQSIFFHCSFTNCTIDNSKTNDKLRDLVIENIYRDTRTCSCYKNCPHNTVPIYIFDMLRKFPSIENLAVRENSYISDDEILEMVQLLPKLVLLDFRGSKKVTSRSADFLENYRKETGRNITIYYSCEGEEPSNWPKLNRSRNQICFGFDFMKHCFFRSYNKLPILMIPEDNSI